MFRGYHDKLLNDQRALRKAVMVIAEVFNRTMGGKGVASNIMQSWPMPEDGGSQMTIEDARSILERHERILAEKKKKNE